VVGDKFDPVTELQEFFHSRCTAVPDTIGSIISVQNCFLDPNFDFIHRGQQPRYETVQSIQVAQNEYLHDVQIILEPVSTSAPSQRPQKLQERGRGSSLYLARRYQFRMSKHLALVTAHGS
jgi:hypothetical protein